MLDTLNSDHMHSDVELLSAVSDLSTMIQVKLLHFQATGQTGNNF